MKDDINKDNDAPLAVDLQRGVSCNAREKIEGFIEECFKMAKMKSHGFDTYDEASEVIYELDIEIDKFIKENCN